MTNSVKHNPPPQEELLHCSESLDVPALVQEWSAELPSTQPQTVEDEDSMDAAVG